MKEVTRCGSSMVSVPEILSCIFFAIQGHSGGQLIAPEMAQVAIPYNCKEFFSTKAVLLTSALFWRHVSPQEKKKAKKEDTPSTSHLSTLLGKI